MTKPEMLRILRLLSAMESVLATLSRSDRAAPDYLYEEMSACVEVLEREIVGGQKP